MIFITILYVLLLIIMYNNIVTILNKIRIYYILIKNKKTTMKTFTLFWLTGEREVISGDNIANAFTRAGYSAGAIRALDFYYEGDNQDYVWDMDKRNWFLTEEAKIKKFGKIIN